MARIEKMSFDAYNESDVLIAAVERYFERTGHYRNAFWQIKSTGTETTLPIAGSTESAYQGRLWEGQRKMP